MQYIGSNNEKYYGELILMKVIKESEKEYVEIVKETDFDNLDDFQELLLYMKLTEIGAGSDVPSVEI